MGPSHEVMLHSGGAALKVRGSDKVKLYETDLGNAQDWPNGINILPGTAWKTWLVRAINPTEPVFLKAACLHIFEQRVLQEV